MATKTKTTPAVPEKEAMEKVAAAKPTKADTESIKSRLKELYPEIVVAKVDKRQKARDWFEGKKRGDSK